MTRNEWLKSEDPASMLHQLLGREPRGVQTAWGRMAVATDRKLRLFACAVSRIVGLVPDEPIDATEAWADGGGPKPKGRWVILDGDCAETAASIGYGSMFGPVVDRQAQKAAILRDIIGDPFRPVKLPGQAVKCPARCERVGGHATYRVYESAGPESRWVMCGRCVGAGRVDGPCPWITPDVLSLALAAYEERLPDGTLDNARLAVLSDALEEAGCVGDAAWTCGDDGKHSHGGTASGVYHGVKHDTDPRKPHHHHDEKCPRTHSPHPVLAHLRSHGLHYRGMWSLDLVLGRA